MQHVTDHKFNKTLCVQRSINARSRNHCYSRTAVSNTYSECVFVALPAWRQQAPYYIVICGLPGTTIFFHIIS